MTMSHSGLIGQNWKDASDSWAAAHESLKAGFVDPGPIAFIDMGGIIPGHPGLLGRNITTPIAAANGSKSSHAMEVAGILVNSCDAKLLHYNVWSETGLDRTAFHDALRDVAKQVPRPAVLNLSIGSKDFEPITKTLIEECMSAGVIVVAAAGDYEDSDAVYPAAIEYVIGVGAVNRHGRPIKTTQYDRAFLSAPGEAIQVLQDTDGFRKQDGTSYAAAFVSAAVWLIRGRIRDPGQQNMRTLLRQLVKPPLKIFDVSQVGFGVLDLSRVAEYFNSPSGAAVLATMAGPVTARTETPTPSIPDPAGGNP